jgi:membrane protease YdiL (CAAX protease family)
MNTSTGQISRPNNGAGSLFKPASLFVARPSPGHPLWLLLETVAVAAGTVAVVRLLNVNGAPAGGWFMIPAVLVAAALIPAWLARREFPCFGLHADHAGLAVRTVCRTCLCIFPAVFLGLWLLASLNMPIPLRPVITGRQNWLWWLLYQFLYVAVAEEVFFRAYIQANMEKLFRHARRLPPAMQQRAVILVSAACFALAHVVVQGRITSALVFLPGLVLAWLFARTRCLLAPILFHGLANVSYGLMALALT